MIITYFILLSFPTDVASVEAKTTAINDSDDEMVVSQRHLLNGGDVYRHLPRKTLTVLERSQLRSIHCFLSNAIKAIQGLEEKEEALRLGRSVDTFEEMNTFRYIMIDLYSVLDYTILLLYCHFSNKGLPDSSENLIKIRFPAKPTGVKISPKEEHDRREKWVQEQVELLWGSKIGKATHFWREIGEVYLKAQPKLEADNSGSVKDEKGHPKKPTITGENEESFALLHQYRNCVIHRHLICTDSQEAEFGSEHVQRYWVDLPEHVTRSSQDECKSRPLLDILRQLYRFVVKAASKLLCSSLLLPSARVLLQEHFKGYRMEINFETASGMRKAKVKVTTEQGMKVAESYSGDHKLQEDAEEEACIRSIEDLANKDILPDSPYSLFTLHHVQAIPPVQVLDKTPNKTYCTLLDEYRQRLERVGLNLKVDWIGPDPVTDREQHYSACVDLSIVTTADGGGGEKLVRIVSGDHEEVGKDKAKEAAVAEVMEECIHLGIIQLARV